MVFADESKFNLYSPDGDKKVRKRPGSRLQDHHIIRLIKFGGGNIMYGKLYVVIA